MASDTYNLLQCGICIDVGVDELPTITGNFYPNPTTGNITIELEKMAELGRIEVFDLQGKLVHIQPERLPAEVFELDLNHLPNGVYIIQAISTESEILIERVIK